MEIKDELTFTNLILKDTLTGEDKKELILSAMKLLPDINKAELKNLTNVKSFVNCVRNKLIKINAYKLPKLNYSSENLEADIIEKNKKADLKNNIVLDLKNRLEAIGSELEILDGLNSTKDSTEESNNVKVFNRIISTDITNMIAHILSALQVTGKYEDKGVERNILDDVFSLKARKGAALAKLKSAKVVKDIEGKPGYTYCFTVKLRNYRFQWHIRDMRVGEYVKDKEASVYIPQRDYSTEKSKLLALGIPEDKIIEKAYSRFIPYRSDKGANRQLITKQSNSEQIKKYYIKLQQDMTNTSQENSLEEISGGGSYADR